jgi:hypothetical protein
MEYRLAIIARHKIYIEAVRAEQGFENLRILIAHLNLLDSLEAHDALHRLRQKGCLPIRDLPQRLTEETIVADVSSVDH